jgi:hypothetical protein
MGQRYWFLEGAFRTVGHVIALQDQAKGNCVADWYLRSADKAARRQLIEKTLADNPTAGETTVILGLLTQACGPLVSKPNR